MFFFVYLRSLLFSNLRLAMFLCRIFFFILCKWYISVLKMFCELRRAALFSCRICLRRQISKDHFYSPQMAVSKTQDAIIFYHPDQNLKYKHTRPFPSEGISVLILKPTNESTVLSMKSEEIELLDSKPPSVFKIAKKFKLMPRNVHRARYRIKRKLPGFIDEDERPLM